LKEEALDYTIWRARFGRGFGPVVRQTAKWMNKMNEQSYLTLYIFRPSLSYKEPDIAYFYELYKSSGLHSLLFDIIHCWWPSIVSSTRCTDVLLYWLCSISTICCMDNTGFCLQALFSWVIFRSKHGNKLILAQNSDLHPLGTRPEKNKITTTKTKACDLIHDCCRFSLCFPLNPARP
jgi:hypothetical protein